jgi:hypothetical protein
MAGQRRIPIGDEIRSLVELLPLPIRTNEKYGGKAPNGNDDNR